MRYRISGNFQGIYTSRISLVNPNIILHSIRSTVTICEIRIREIENEGPFVKYTTLENNHLTVLV